jgi:methionyl-tRNA synthetase
MDLQGTPLADINPVIIALALVWSLVWKGIALWKASQLSHKKWFIVIFLINTFGILEIIYLYFVARKYTVETEYIEKDTL